jgi:hypothetical protein
MPSPGAPALLHIVGYLTGASLYAMLLAMVIRTRGPGYRLTLATAVLGVAWNVGELTAHAFDSAGLLLARDLMSAISYAALGFLAAVAVHSAGRGHADDEPRRTTLTRTSAIAVAGYACAAVAGVMQLFEAVRSGTLPSSVALVVLTTGLVALSAVLLLTRRRQEQGRRALWMIALALFAVSALHLGRFHGASEGWTTELLGHHASIPLAFAILYQDYRFGFADLFLKRALTLLALVTIVFVSWSLLEPSLLGPSPRSPAIGALMAMWIGTALVFPWMHRQISAFVDRIVLRRGNYAALVDSFSATLQGCESEERVLTHACALLGAALNADVTPRRTGVPSGGPGSHEIAIQTAEDPQHVLTIGRLASGRRLLSDDLLMLERMALLAGRRIDALRLSDERYERMLREREISTLAAEAELRALRAQINPHFLFNALTTLGYLIQSAPGRALDTLMHLTTLLRSALRSEGEFTTLGHERELVECYLQIERERFEERLDATVDIPGELAEVSLPSLIVQPLVENAIKHGIGRSRTGGRVVVSARLEGGVNPALRITVRNSGAPMNGRTPAAEGGIGLQNVERRLQCYYGDAARFTLTRADNGETVAEITLPAGEVGDDDAAALIQHTRG